VLRQMQDVLQRDRADIEEEWQRLIEGGFLLKERNTSEREKAATK
jgi:hypothetical protein